MKMNSITCDQDLRERMDILVKTFFFFVFRYSIRHDETSVVTCSGIYTGVWAPKLIA